MSKGFHENGTASIGYWGDFFFLFCQKGTRNSLFNSFGVKCCFYSFNKYSQWLLDVPEVLHNMQQNKITLNFVSIHWPTIII